MSRNIVLVTSCLALTLAFLLHDDKIDRQPASLVHAKHGIVQKQALGKLRGQGATVSIESNSKTNTGVYNLKGKITAQNAISGAQVKWALGKNVQLISGPQQNTINSLPAGASTEFELTVQGQGQVFLHLMDASGTLLGETAHVNTRSLGRGYYSTINAAKKKGPPKGMRIFY